jgi:(p)ppGpp synthase/HD superfamily hydrolase
MFSRSAGPTEVLTAVAERRSGRSERGARADRAASDRSSALTGSALAFALRCHAGQRRTSDGAPFIEHPLEVAWLLRTAGCSDVLVAAGLLHDVVANTEVSAGELTERFGAEVANLVAAVSNDASVHSYRRRKQVLREQVHGAGPDAAVLFAADRISKLRELPTQLMRDRARFDEAAPGSRVWGRLEYFQQMRLEHFQQSLRMLLQVAPGHPLVRRLADDLGTFPITIGHGAIVGQAAIGPRERSGRR